MTPTIFTPSTIFVGITLLLCSTPQQFVRSRMNADTSVPQASKAQAITEDVAGLHRIIINTPKGNKIFVNLPDDMDEGDTISGTVFAEAAGKTDAERAANLLELKDQSIEVLGQTVPATGGPFTSGACCYPKAPNPPCSIVFPDTRPDKPPSGRILIPKECIFNYKPRRDAKLRFDFLPTYGMAGQFIEVNGSFNGLFASRDYIKIGGLEMKLLAESPRKTVFFNTSTVIGPTEIEVSEEGKVQKGQFRNLSLSLSALKYDLRKGERTKLHVIVKGLANLQEEIPLRLENRSTK